MLKLKINNLQIVGGEGMGHDYNFPRHVPPAYYDNGGTPEEAEAFFRKEAVKEAIRKTGEAIKEHFTKKSDNKSFDELIEDAEKRCKEENSIKGFNIEQEEKIQDPFSDR